MERWGENVKTETEIMYAKREAEVETVEEATERTKG